MPVCRLHRHRSSPSDFFFLESCDVHVVIADVHVSVDITQRFKNSNTEAQNTTYTFGLCADAAVCGFKMIRDDGTEVEGIVMEKEEAKKEYDRAVEQGYTASLGAQETKDVFSISVGNISASEVITIKLRYIQTLKDDEKKDQVRFMFPRAYVPRYGQAPTANTSRRTEPANQSFTLNAVVQQSGTIKSISCPSGHLIEIELGKPEGFDVDASDSDSQFAKVALRGSSGLDQDVVLVVTATDLDGPRCFVESHAEHDTVALGLTFVPRFKLPDIKTGMEYIFVVDRSGSMEGANIRLVREALVVLLRGLPTNGTTFNIFSFGSSNSKLWKTSQAYSQATLDQATKHVDSMRADYGGTEIASALESVYASLQKPLTRPVSVLLLTDGGAWDVSTCVNHTRDALSTIATLNNFIRVFTVGIGDGASTDTCNSIAKAGNGFSVYVGPNEPMVGKCARLVRAARTPPIRDIKVSWTGVEDDFEMVDDDLEPLDNGSDSEMRTRPALSQMLDIDPPAVSLFDTDKEEKDTVGPPAKTNITLPPVPRIQQAPLNPEGIFPGTRTMMYAIISNKQTPIPTSITIRGVAAGIGCSVELDVPVRKMIRAKEQGNMLLHTLAAKALITDRENNIHSFPASVASSFVNNDALRDSYLKEEIVRLGTTYELTSRHTSFVAVDYQSGEIQGRGLAKPAEPRAYLVKTRGGYTNFVQTDAFGATTISRSRTAGGGSKDRSASPEPQRELVMKCKSSLSGVPRMRKKMARTPGEDEGGQEGASASPLVAVARLQEFDGCFKLAESLLKVLGISTSAEEFKERCLQEGVEEDVALTVLALTWLENAGDEATLDLQEKASEWLAAKLGSVEQLVQMKEKILKLFSA